MSKETPIKRFDFSIVRNLRTKWGLTAEELARKANITRATVAKIESGNGNPTIETIGAISHVFQLSASELIRLSEKAQLEPGKTTGYREDGFEGTHIWFPNFEIYHLKAPTAKSQLSDPQRHDNTAEVCVVLKGRLRITVGGQTHELGPGMAMRFKALHQHRLDILEASEFLLIHHNLS